LLISNFDEFIFIIIIYSYTMYEGTCIRELTTGLVTLPSEGSIRSLYFGQRQGVKTPKRTSWW